MMSIPAEPARPGRSSLTLVPGWDTLPPRSKKPIAMLDLIENLLVLQDCDRKIRKLEEELSQIEPGRRGFLARTADTQAGLESARQLVKQLESNRKNLELDVETKKGQISRYANQQLQTRKNEEYRALAKEIETCKEEIRLIEDREIDLMEQSEKALAGVVTATQAADQARKLAQDQIGQLNNREKELRHDMEQLQAGRVQLAATVEDGPRRRYERLMTSKGENVVVGVNHGVCGGCHMKLPPQLVISCQSRKDLVTCSNCGRILYYTPDMDLTVID